MISISFGRSVTAALSQLHPDASSIDSSNSTTNSRKTASLPKTKGMRPRYTILLFSAFVPQIISDSDSEAGSQSDDDDESASQIQRFLAVWGLEEYLHIFQKEQINLETLMLLTETDLKSLSLPPGPFRKLVIAIQKRKNALANPGAISDSRL